MSFKNGTQLSAMCAVVTRPAPSEKWQAGALIPYSLTSCREDKGEGSGLATDRRGLFRPQSNEGIDPGGPACRRVAGDHHDGEQEGGHCNERERVGWRDREQQAAHDAPRTVSTGHAEGGADAGQDEAVAEDEAEDVPAARPQRHSNADVTGALRHQVREHSEQAD